MKVANQQESYLNRERWKVLIRLKKLIDPPMNFLAFIWLILTVVDLSKGLPSLGSHIVSIIWIIFWVHFILEFSLAPQKKVYLKHNWLTALSLLMPAFRILRVFRTLKLFSLLRGTSLVRIFASVNRGMNALSKSFGNKGFSYVISLTGIIVILGAAGIISFEQQETNYFKSFGTGLWWASMMVTTMGSDYFPKSSEGRFLAFFLALYGFAVFGYVTATVASFFMGKEKDKKKDEYEVLRREIQELKELLRQSK